MTSSSTVSSSFAFLFSATPVAQAPNGAWYITAGRPGFNLAKNNRGGWPTEAAALAASAKLAR